MHPKHTVNSRLPLTVLIPTLNAGGHLEELLDSIGDSVEAVMVLDSRSTDATVDIALAHGIPVVQRPFTTHGDQFQWMMTHMPVTTDWVFLLAQDERFTPSLVASIRGLLDAGATLNGYTVRWRLWLMGRPLHVVIDNIRLLRHGHFHIADALCNEQIIVDGVCGRLDGILEHKDTLTLHQWYEKQNLYSTLEAIATLRGEGEFAIQPRLLGNKRARRAWIKKWFFRLPFRYVLAWFYNVVFTGAWKDGRDGLGWAHLRAEVYRMWEYKVREMRRTGRIPELPKARHGDFDARVMATELQQRLLPQEWHNWRARQ